MIRLYSLLFLALFMTGCQEVNVRQPFFSNFGGTFHQRSEVLRDIPLPRGFDLMEGSFCFGTESFRYGEFYLQGSGKLEEWLDYYSKQMLRGNWQQKEKDEQDTLGSLLFEKSGEYCTVKFKEEAGQLLMRLEVGQSRS